MKRSKETCTCRTRRGTSAVPIKGCEWHRKYRAELRAKAKGKR